MTQFSDVFINSVYNLVSTLAWTECPWQDLWSLTLSLQTSQMLILSRNKQEYLEMLHHYFMQSVCTKHTGIGHSPSIYKLWNLAIIHHLMVTAMPHPPSLYIWYRLSLSEKWEIQQSVNCGVDSLNSWL